MADSAPLLDRVRLRAPAAPSIGIIRNAKARRNIGHLGILPLPGIHYAGPRSQAELDATMVDFARQGIDALVINGGDGTIRDVLSAAARRFDRMPRVAVLPSGKTNALAVDLGIPRDWTEADAVRALRCGRVVERSPIAMYRPGSDIAERHGFILGAGKFVDATALAQKTHRLGAFNGLAVGLAVAGCVAQTLFGGAENPWRQGTPMRIALGDGRTLDGSKYLLFASTLERLPLGFRPFGAPRPGLKMLTVDEQPRRLAAMLPALLGGGDLPEESGYRRDDTDRFELIVEGEIILDGEIFPGGAMRLARGTPIGFAVP